MSSSPTLARLVGRPLDVLRYRAVYALHARRFLLDRERFAGRSVLLLGPARTLADDLAGLRLAEFDLVVKMNNGLHVPVGGNGRPSFRCDVLFHSLTADAAPVTPEALARAGVRCLVHRTTGRGRFPLTLDAARRFAPVDVRVVPPGAYRALSARLGGASPTTGLVCLDFLLSCDLARLAVAGFTFFATRYVPGYDDRDRSDADSLTRVRAAGHHDPEAERRLLREAFADARRKGRRVELGPEVRSALERRAETQLRRPPMELERSPPSDHAWTRALVHQPDKERPRRLVAALTSTIETDSFARPGRALWGPLGPCARAAVSDVVAQRPGQIGRRFRATTEARWLAARLARRRPDLAVCWNGIKARYRLLMAAAADAAVDRAFLEEAPLPGRISVDLRGINQGNSLPRRIDFYRAWAARHPEARGWRHLASDLEARRTTRGDVAQEDVDLVQEGPFVFFPLQVPGDTQLITFGGRHRAMDPWIREVVTAAQALPEGWHLRVKEHPSANRALAHVVEAGNGTRVRLDNRTDTFRQVAQARAVVTVNSSVGLQAFYFDKPVLALGEAFWCFDRLATFAGTAGALEDAFARVASLTFDASARDAFMTYLTERFFPCEADILSGTWGLSDLADRQREMQGLLAEIGDA